MGDAIIETFKINVEEIMNIRDEFQMGQVFTFINHYTPQDLPCERMNLLLNKTLGLGAS